MEKIPPSSHGYEHTNGFDLLRLIAASAVIFSHAYPLTGGVAMPSPGFLGSHIGTIGVKIFFVISGFLIAQSWLMQPDLVAFYKKRCLRIFPALVVVVLFCALVIGPVVTTISLDDYFFNSGVRHFIIKNILLFPIYNLPAVFDENIYPAAVNGSLWSLPVEFFMYLLTPIILCIRSRHKPCVAIAAIVAVLIFIHAQYSDSYKFVFYGTFVQSAIDVIPFFCLGMVWCIFRLNRFKAPIIVFFILAICAISLENPFIGSIVLLLFLPHFVVSVGTTNFMFCQKIIKGRDYSYGIYLYGFPVQQLLVYMTDNGMSAVENALYSWLVALGCAALSFHLIEKPALKLKKMSLKRRSKEISI